MLELRPTCEHCNKALRPDSTDAMICSFECTFCTTCATDVLANVCPNCGGGLCPRPIRPRLAHVADLNLEHYPGSSIEIHKPVAMGAFRSLRARLQDTPPEDR